ncbi:MAG: preprotein translocase subunit SecE [Patescibacteria group bacterium]
MRSLISYLKNVRGELSHVVWPDRRQAIIHTVLIILISTVIALVITGFDYIFTNIVNRLVSGY